MPKGNIHTWKPNHYGSNRGLCDTIAGDNHTTPLPPGISVTVKQNGLITIKRETGQHSVYNPDKGWDTFTGPSKL
jgi:hypothetical protein